jgi:hypothetical protein
MKYVKFLMALLAVCILAMPAFSMQNSEMKQTHSQDQAPLIGDAAGGNQPFDGQGNNNAPRSMMGGKINSCEKKNEHIFSQEHADQKDGQALAPQSMMDGKTAPCDQNPAGEKGGKSFATKSMMDGKFNTGMDKQGGNQGSEPASGNGLNKDCPPCHKE